MDAQTDHDLKELERELLRCIAEIREHAERQIAPLRAELHRLYSLRPPTPMTMRVDREWSLAKLREPEVGNEP